MRARGLLGHLGTAAMVAVLTAGCDSSAVVQPEEGATFNRSVHSRTAQDELFKAVRQATSRFHSTTQAIKAGYQPDTHCVAAPGFGGMGYHWANFALVDPVFDPLQPEVLLYAQKPNGQLELVAVEYIVINVGQPRPSFGDHLFDIGGTPVRVPHWSLHVWLYKDNPSGTFARFNPNVTCP